MSHDSMEFLLVYKSRQAGGQLSTRNPSRPLLKRKTNSVAAKGTGSLKSFLAKGLIGVGELMIAAGESLAVCRGFTHQAQGHGA